MRARDSVRNPKRGGGGHVEKLLVERSGSGRRPTQESLLVSCRNDASGVTGVTNDRRCCRLSGFSSGRCAASPRSVSVGYRRGRTGMPDPGSDGSVKAHCAAAGDARSTVAERSWMRSSTCSRTAGCGGAAGGFRVVRVCLLPLVGGRQHGRPGAPNKCSTRAGNRFGWSTLRAW